VTGPVEHADLQGLVDRRNHLARQCDVLGAEVERSDRLTK
jgi:hypothetical protein